MDQPQYSSNVVNTTTASYPSPSSTSSHGLQPQQQQQQQQAQQQNHASHPPQTLPPLQPQNQGMQQQPAPPYGSYPHTPRTPATPNTPASATTMSNYPPPPAQNVARAPYPGMMPAPQYQQQSHPGYPATTSMMPQATTSMVHPQPIAPAPPGGRNPPVLRPMPAGGVIPQPGISSPYAQSPLMPQPQMLQQDGDQPTHVVGSQGRRGILPSAPGRPQAPVAGSPAAKNQIPQKDADGKFPCPHCNKTYLHAKHLKRHLLRHTGDRPYMCVLCRDTFSRSDILKRHFQKCSIRRGNPTGASHLSHPHAHVKKNAAAQKALGADNDLNPMNGMGNMGPDGMVHPFGLIPAQDGMGNMANDQNHLSRQPSMNRIDDPNDRDRRNVPGPVMGTNGHQGYNGNVPHSMAPAINPQLANYSMPPNQNNGIQQMFPGQAQNQQSAGLDWSQMFQAGAQHLHVNDFPPNFEQTQNATTKQELSSDSMRPTGGPDDVKPASADDRPPLDSGAPAIELNDPDQDPYQIISNRLITFFDGSDQAQRAIISSFFTPDNVKCFLDRYTDFHRHFSIIHIPTFGIMDAYVGLMAGVCCVGAIYSNRVTPQTVRDVTTLLKPALERKSQLLASIDDGFDPAMKYDNSLCNLKTDIEELQAIMLMLTLLIWNGTPEQRQSALRLFPPIASLAQKGSLMTISRDDQLYSVVHQPDFSPVGYDVTTFHWDSWVEQEKRIRILFFIFLFDASMGLYFNIPPTFDPLQLQLPLPADDAAWDAPDPQICAEALGLCGPEAAKACNPNGTRRATQPLSHLVLVALLNSSFEIQPGTTNLYGKFITIHALLALMRRALVDSLGAGAFANRANTPLSHVDWAVNGGTSNSWSPSTPNSGRTTPVDGVMRPETVSVFATALNKFKKNWDADMASQFDSISSQATANPRRQGFSKDGVHFYWLANYILKNMRVSDLQQPADQRMMLVLRLLKQVKSWVMPDGAARGEELGSIGEIDKDYGAQDLTLNMVSLFTPMSTGAEETSSGSTSVKLEG